MIILGVNSFHTDSAACVVKDGILHAAAEEERFRRVKHWAGFPSEATKYCLREAKVALRDIDCVAVNHNPWRNWVRKIAFALTTAKVRLLRDRIQTHRHRDTIEQQLEKIAPQSAFRGKLYRVEHHVAHCASAFFSSPFEEAAVVSVDGSGDFASAAWGVGKGTDMNIRGRVFFPHSLGIFYMAITQYLGFKRWGDEYKVMGLAPYGNLEFVREMDQVVRLKDDGTFQLNMQLFRHGTENLESWEEGEPHVGRIFTRNLEELLGPSRSEKEPIGQRHKDIARSAQNLYEETLFHLLNSVHQQCDTDKLALAGGCAMNSVANGKITKATPFRQVYVHAAAGDAGGAIGAAMSLWHELTGATRSNSMYHAYWGPEFSDEEIGQLLSNRRNELNQAACTLASIQDEADLYTKTAETIAAGKVVGWFQGRMEWGPRALGNRSILADPRRHDMKEILNLKIKRRESFRPFAPSVLREAVGEWFETDDDVPFMEKVFVIREEKRDQIPAVVHVDGTGRLQTVTRDSNPRYYRLIEAFRQLTGVPMLLNTSFNENEPIVCRPEEALDCFLRTRMDVLVLGNWYLERTPGRD